MIVFLPKLQSEENSEIATHSQKVEQGRTRGEYRIFLPDNRWQIVSYVADDDGYRATVRYESAVDNPEPLQPEQTYWGFSTGPQSSPKPPVQVSSESREPPVYRPAPQPQVYQPAQPREPPAYPPVALSRNPPSRDPPRYPEPTNGSQEPPFNPQSYRPQLIQPQLSAVYPPYSGELRSQVNTYIIHPTPPARPVDERRPVNREPEPQNPVGPLPPYRPQRPVDLPSRPPNYPLRPYPIDPRPEIKSNSEPSPPIYIQKPKTPEKQLDSIIYNPKIFHPFFEPIIDEPPKPVSVQAIRPLHLPKYFENQANPQTAIQANLERPVRPNSNLNEPRPHQHYETVGNHRYPLTSPHNHPGETRPQYHNNNSPTYSNPPTRPAVLPQQTKDESSTQRPSDPSYSDRPSFSQRPLYRPESPYHDRPSQSTPDQRPRHPIKPTETHVTQPRPNYQPEYKPTTPVYVPQIRPPYQERPAPTTEIPPSYPIKPNEPYQAHDRPHYQTDNEPTVAVYDAQNRPEYQERLVTTKPDESYQPQEQYSDQIEEDEPAVAVYILQSGPPYQEKVIPTTSAPPEQTTELYRPTERPSYQPDDLNKPILSINGPQKRPNYEAEPSYTIYSDKPKSNEPEQDKPANNGERETERPTLTYVPQPTRPTYETEPSYPERPTSVSNVPEQSRPAYETGEPFFYPEKTISTSLPQRRPIYQAEPIYLDKPIPSSKESERPEEKPVVDEPEVEKPTPTYTPQQKPTYPTVPYPDYQSRPNPPQRKPYLSRPIRPYRPLPRPNYPNKPEAVDEQSYEPESAYEEKPAQPYVQQQNRRPYPFKPPSRPYGIQQSNKDRLKYQPYQPKPVISSRPPSPGYYRPKEEYIPENYKPHTGYPVAHTGYSQVTAIRPIPNPKEQLVVTIRPDDYESLEGIAPTEPEESILTTTTRPRLTPKWKFNPATRKPFFRPTTKTTTTVRPPVQFSTELPIEPSIESPSQSGEESPLSNRFRFRSRTPSNDAFGQRTQPRRKQPDQTDEFDSWPQEEDFGQSESIRSGLRLENEKPFLDSVSIVDEEPLSDLEGFPPIEEELISNSTFNSDVILFDNGGESSPLLLRIRDKGPPSVVEDLNLLPVTTEAEIETLTTTTTTTTTAAPSTTTTTIVAPTTTTEKATTTEKPTTIKTGKKKKRVRVKGLRRGNGTRPLLLTGKRIQTTVLETKAMEKTEKIETLPKKEESVEAVVETVAKINKEVNKPSRLVLPVRAEKLVKSVKVEKAGKVEKISPIGKTANTTATRSSKIRFPPRIRFVEKNSDRVTREKGNDDYDEDLITADTVHTAVKSRDHYHGAARDMMGDHIMTSGDLMDFSLNAIPIDQLDLVYETATESSSESEEISEE